MTNVSKIKRSYTIMLTISFFLLICLPGIVMVKTPKRMISENEKRKLAALPKIQWNTQAVRSYPARFEEFMKDHFGFREQLIHLHNLFQFQWLKKSPNPQVARGKDGWLFYQTDTFGISLIDDFRGTVELSALQLEGMRRHLETKRNWLAERGIQYLYVAVPNKQSIYPEFLPDYFNIVSSSTQLDQFLAYMKKHSDLEILDLRPVLQNAKNHGLSYYKTDSHWNDRGAYIAYRSIIDRIGKKLPKIQPGIPLTEIQTTIQSQCGRDLAKLIGLPEITENDVPVLSLKTVSFQKNDSPSWAVPSWPWWTQPFETDSKNATAQAIVFRDSFIDKMLPFLARHFRKAAYIATKLDYSILDCLLEKIHPDIVIEEGIERHTFLAFLPSAIHTTIGNDWLIRGDYGKAIRSFRNALALYPDDPENYNNLGYAFMKDRRFDKAIYYFQTALKFKPEYEKAKKNLRLATRIIDQAQKSINNLKDELTLKPGHIPLLMKIGDVNQQLGKMDISLLYYKKILEIDPYNIPAMNQTAIINVRKRQYDTAASLFRKILDLKPEHAETYYNLACIHAMQDHLETSVAYLQAAIKHGYSNMMQIRRDADLENIRKTAYYQVLIKKHPETKGTYIK